MIQTRENLFFAMKAPVDFIRIDSAANDLKRNFAIQLSILREINIAHSTAADERKDLVMIDCLSGFNSR